MKAKNVAIEAALEAGTLLLNMSKETIRYKMKNEHDILADADLASELLIIGKIKRAFPKHEILSEEAGNRSTKSDFKWLVDPIDGTINYSRGIGEYCISIALANKGEISLGVIYKPSSDELYVAQRGEGAFCNGKRIHVSPEKKPVNMILATDNSSDIAGRVKNYEALAKASAGVRHVRTFGSGALHMALVASGKIDAYYKMGFHYWDYAAGAILVSEAGGKVTDLQGKPILEKSSSILASNNKAHGQILSLLKD